MARHLDCERRENMSHRTIRLLAVAAALLLACLLSVATLTVLADPRLPPAALPSSNPGPPPAGALAPPSWSSGWTTIAPNTAATFNHNLGLPPEKYIIDVLFRDIDGGLGIHRRFYGGADYGSDELGAHWFGLDANQIKVFRWRDDPIVDQVLVKVRVQPTLPDYDSGWVPIRFGQTITIAHGLGGPAVGLGVGLWFSGTGTLIHQYAYGGYYQDEGPARGAYWHNLASNTVQVTRLPDDNTVQEVRVVVSQGTTPAYDSLVDRGGWQSIAPGGLVTFTHNLGISPELLLVRAECLSPDPALGINQKYAGGDYDPAGPGWQGSSLQNMTENQLTVFRFPQDTVCPQVRVVIYTPSEGFSVYLPLLLKAFAP
jgi:hypothetical protein